MKELSERLEVVLGNCEKELRRYCSIHSFPRLGLHIFTAYLTNPSVHALYI
jgi:hypothetical protein